MAAQHMFVLSDPNFSWSISTQGGKKERIWYKTKGRLIVICIQTVMKALDTLKGSKSKDMFHIDARLFFFK